jgi:hypothetical protein
MAVGERLEEALELGGLGAGERRDGERRAALDERQRLRHGEILSTRIDEFDVLHIFTAID